MERQFWTVFKGEFYQYSWDRLGTGAAYVPGVTQNGDPWLDSLATAALYAGGI